jgi:hypothetical protein
MNSLPQELIRIYKQHEKEPSTTTTTTQKTPKYKPNLKHNLKHKSPENLCTQNSYNNQKEKPKKKGQASPFLQI